MTPYGMAVMKNILTRFRNEAFNRHGYAAADCGLPCRPNKRFVLIEESLMSPFCRCMRTLRSQSGAYLTRVVVERNA